MCRRKDNKLAAIAAQVLGTLGLMTTLGAIGTLVWLYALIDGIVKFLDDEDQGYLDDVRKVLNTGFWTAVAFYVLMVVAASLNIAAPCKRSSFGLWIAALVTSFLVTVGFAVILGFVLSTFMHSGLIAFGAVPCGLALCMFITDGVGAYQLRSEQVDGMKHDFKRQERRQNRPRDHHDFERQDKKYQRSNQLPRKTPKHRNDAPVRKYRR